MLREEVLSADDRQLPIRETAGRQSALAFATGDDHVWLIYISYMSVSPLLLSPITLTNRHHLCVIMACNTEDARDEVLSKHLRPRPFLHSFGCPGAICPLCLFVDV